MAKVVLRIVPGHSQALKVVDDLKAAGLSNNNISVLMSDKASTKDSAERTHAKTSQAGAVTGAKVGGVLGGTLGLLVGIGTPAIPGVGPFIAAGPLMGALSGTALSVAAGCISGSLVGLGITEIEAKRCEGKLEAGNVLTSVHVETSDLAQRVKDVFQRAGADDISVSTEASTRTERRSAVSPTDGRTCGSHPPSAPRLGSSTICSRVSQRNHNYCLALDAVLSAKRSAAR